MKTITLCISLILITGCSESSGPKSGPVSMTTDRASYTFKERSDGWSEAEVVVRLTNTSDETIHLSRCNLASPTPIYVVFRAAPRVPDHSLGTAQDNGCPGGVMSFAVRPGEDRIDAIKLTYEPQRDGSKAGEYLIAYWLRNSPNENEAAPDLLATTNVFRLVE